MYGSKYQYKKFRFELGIFSESHWDLQLKYWDNRYVCKVFQDLNKFASSADLGGRITCNWNKWITIDAAIVNGDGYKNLKTVRAPFKKEFSLIFVPQAGYLFKIYYDTYPLSANQQNVVTFFDYRIPAKFTWGIEYDIRLNHKGIVKHNLTGISTYYLHPRLYLPGRFHYAHS